MLGPHTHRDNPVSRIMCAPVAPPVTVCKHLKIQKKIGREFCSPVSEPRFLGDGEALFSVCLATARHTEKIVVNWFCLCDGYTKYL
jgi:hypothetical protein